MNCSNASSTICCSVSPKPKNVELAVAKSPASKIIVELRPTWKPCHVSKLGSHRNVSASSFSSPEATNSWA